MVLGGELSPRPTGTTVPLPKEFLPLPDPKFTCQDIRELQWEKRVAYTKALQLWAEKANLPTEGQPCLLAGSIVELKEEMKCYISFTDKDVVNGVTLPEESPVTQPKEATPRVPSQHRPTCL